MGDLYDSATLALKKDEMPQFRHAAFDKAARAVYERGEFSPAMLRDERVRGLIDETNRVLSSALTVSHETPPELTAALRNNVFIFSGLKTYHSLSEVGLSLTDEEGNTKSFADFHRDVKAIDARYNSNYLYAEYEAIVYGSYIEYPPLYADTRHVPIEKQGIGDYWNIINDYQPRADLASLRCMPYSEFLILYCFYKRTKEAHAAGKTYTRPNSLEGLYKELSTFFDGNQRDATLFLILSNYIRNGKEIEKVEPYLKEYKEKYNLNKEYAAILDSLMQ